MAVTPPAEEPDGLHAVRTHRTSAGVHAVCVCGAWEGWWNTEKAERYVRDDHDHHRRAASNGGNLPPVQ